MSGLPDILKRALLAVTPPATRAERIISACEEGARRVSGFDFDESYSLAFAGLLCTHVRSLCEEVSRQDRGKAELVKALILCVDYIKHDDDAAAVCALIGKHTRADRRTA